MEYKSRWHLQQEQRRRAGEIIAFFHGLLFLEGVFPVRGDPPTIGFRFALSSILVLFIISG